MRRLVIGAIIGFLLLARPSDALGQRASAATHAPGATPVPALRADTVAVRSQHLGAERVVFVSLPPSWERTSREYPVVLVLDGEWNFADAHDAASRLARLGHMPEAIVVGVPNASARFEDRLRDLTPPGLSVSGSSLNEGGDRFLDFLELELLPMVRERWRGGRPAMLVGHSSGGVLATYAAATRPAAFPVVVSIDAPIHLGDEWLARRLIEGARGDSQRPLRYSSLEARFGWSDRAWTELEAAAPDGWSLHRVQLEGESHETMPFLATYEGLKFAFADYSIVGAPLPPRGSARAAFGHYNRIEEEFATRLPPPAPVLHNLVEDLLIEGRVQEARTALGWLVEGYGERPAASALETMIERVAARPPLTETVESLRAAPRPSPAELAPYVGEWRGEFRINENARWRGGLRIVIEGDSVVAEIIESAGTEEELIVPVDYLRVVPGGLEFGRVNGMRPMGMLVSAGRLDGDVLEGEQQFRGIVLPLPVTGGNGDGHMPPVVHFRLERT